MGYVQKRLASTAAKLAHASPSQAAAFPPKEAIASTSSKTEFFDAQTWAALQPPPKSELTAFAHRIGLGHILKSPAVIQQACTHPSFVPFFRQHLPDEPIPETNGNLATLGNSLLGLFATEYVHSSYPHLPTRVLKAAVSAYVGPSPCEAIANEMGATPLLRWRRMPDTDLRPPVSYSEALSSIPRALTALVHQHRSVHSARKFVETFFLSRDVDLRSMIKFSDPKLALVETVAKFGRERPISRLLKETGRHSNSPIYVVGVYSGADQLGEGFGSSLKMAEFRAAENALHRLYLTRQPSDSVQLPTSTFPSGEGSIFVAEEWKTHYVPVEMGDSEVHYASSGRSKAQSPGRRASAEDENDVET